jgi:hypothetical protein
MTAVGLAQAIDSYAGNKKRKLKVVHVGRLLHQIFACQIVTETFPVPISP